jgi:hypothetical protein
LNGIHVVRDTWCLEISIKFIHVRVVVWALVKSSKVDWPSASPITIC